MERAGREEVLLDTSGFFFSSWQLRSHDLQRGLVKQSIILHPAVPSPVSGRGLSQGNVQKQTNLITVSVIGFMLEIVSGVNDTDGAGARAHDHRLGRRAAG